MNVIVNKGWTLSFENESDETLNANDVFWHRLNVKFDAAIRPTHSESVIAVFQDKEIDPTYVSKEELLFESKDGTWSAFIPLEIVKMAQTWCMKILVRRYVTTDETTDEKQYVQKGTPFVEFTVENGALLPDGSPVTLATVAELYAKTLDNVKAAENNALSASLSEQQAATHYQGALDSANKALISQEKALISQEAAEISANEAVEAKDTILIVREEMKDSLSQINVNSAHIQNLFSIARANNQFAVLKREQAYTTRQTANDAEIFDNQYTAVKEIKGSTVNSINKYNLTEAKNDTNPGAGTKITVLENGFLVVGKESNNPYVSDYGNGWFRAGGSMFKALPIVHTGDKLNVSVDITLVEDENKLSIAEAFAQYPNAGKIGAFFYDTSSNQAGGHIQLSLSNTTAKQTKTFSCTVPENMNGKPVVLIINLNSFTMKIENIMVTINEDLPSSFVPYFSDLKHANINSIKSTGRNLFDKSKAKDGYEISNEATGEESKSAEWFVTELISVLPNTKYKVSGKANGAAVTQYGLDKKPIGRTQTGNGISGFTTLSNAYFVKLNGKLTEKDTFQLEIGATASEYTPYTEEIYQLPETLELGEWDSFNPQTGEIIRQTRTFTLNPNNVSFNVDGSGKIAHFYYDIGTGVNKAVSNDEVNAISNLYKGITNEEAWYHTNGNGLSASENYIRIYDASFVDLQTFRDYLTANPLTVSYKLETPTIEKIENAPKLYKAWNKGRESVIQGETDNSIYGAMPTITNEYFTAVGAEEEEANE